MASTYTRSAIIEASIAAAKQWLSVEYARYSGSKLTIALAPSVDKFRQLKYIKIHDGNPSEDEGEPITPFAIWAVGSIGLDLEKAGLKKRLANNGIQTGLDKFKGTATFASARPAVLGIGCAFITSDFDEVLTFAETVLNAAPRITLVIAMDNGFQIETSIIIDGELTVPPPDTDVGTLYRFEIPLRISTYIGINTESRVIRKLKVSVLDAHDSTDFTTSKATPGVIFDGDYDTLLAEQIRWNDLFNKASQYYKYDYEDKS